jgi:tetratricopeptide (TPR) repeat protein
MNFADFMRGAEDALRFGDFELARSNYWAAAQMQPADPLVRMRLGLTLKRLGRHHDALDEFTTVTRLSPEYGEAWREKGVVEGLIARKLPADERPSWLHDGQASLERATQLNPEDFDAWASLAGVMKNVKGDSAAAAELYVHAAEISDGHPYPLLNGLRLQAQQTGHLDIESHRDQLEAAESMRRGQMLTTPPTDPPWCFFDVAEIRAYLGDEEGFLATLREGLEHVDADYQPETFKTSLVGLDELGLDVPGLAEALAMLDEKIEALRQT